MRFKFGKGVNLLKHQNSKEKIPLHKVDAHVHIMNARRLRGGIRWARQFAPDYENLDLNASTAELLQHLYDEGVEAFYNFYYPLGSGECREINRWQRNFADSCPAAVPFASLDPGDENKSLIIKEALDHLHLAGFKFHPYIQGFSILDERLVPLYEELQERDGLLVIHTGFSEYYRHPSMVEDCLTFLRRYPRLRTVLAHILFLDLALEDWSVWLEKFPRLYFDATNVFPYLLPGTYDGDQFQQLLSKHSSRMIFGTDFPMGVMYPTGKLHRLAIEICPDQESVDNLMWRTACQLVGITLA